MLLALKMESVVSQGMWVASRICKGQGNRFSPRYCRKKFNPVNILVLALMHRSSDAQLYPNFCDPMNHSPPVPSVCESLQAKILEWVAISFSSRSSPPRD